VLMGSKGLVLVLGCAHAGMVNIMEYVIKKTGQERIFAVLGGTHLDFASPLQVEETIRALKKFKIEKLGVSHCTGWKAALRLSAEFGERFFFGQVGETLEV
jgi:7,8-dihydropterin-6-yl-methyl-4-(beta-D-ribofuranosyl)aminobenzene 5'-phosphate synthase